MNQASVSRPSAAPVRRLRFDHLRMVGWKLLGTVQIINWCGHGQEFVPWPEPDGSWRLVPVWEP